MSRKQTATGFWERANGFYAGLNVAVDRVMTDNGSWYRPRLLNSTLGETIAQKSNPVLRATVLSRAFR